MTDDVETLRRFNRAWSQRVGVLDESFLGSGRPLGPSRILFELGSGPVSVRDLRDRLGLDAGYLSRLLRALEQEQLVSTSDDPSDGRRRIVALTASGRSAWDDLEARSDDIARQVTEPLSAANRHRLADALGTATSLIRASTARLVEVELQSPAAAFALSAYFAELAERFPGGFDPGIQDPAAYRPPLGRFIVAVSDGEVLACGAIQRLSAGVGEIKRMWVDANWRGLGLAGRMLRHLESIAAVDGHTTIRLDTNPTLVDAIGMYRRAGYAEIERYNDNPYAGFWFEKRLTS